MILSIARYESRDAAGPMHSASSAKRTCRASRSASEYTATVAIPIARAVRMMRQAISPRLAIRIFLNIGAFDRLERDVAVLAPGIFEMLVAQHGQAAANALARFVRHDDIVDEAALARDERIRKLF